jgi:hypothetical protein
MSGSNTFEIPELELANPVSARQRQKKRYFRETDAEGTG